MDKTAVVQQMLNGYSKEPQNKAGTFFAPSNIALCKYWGKRNTELNLPITASLSVSLGEFGAKTTISLLKEASSDVAYVNNKQISIESDPTFFSNLTQYLNLFRPTPTSYFCVETDVNLPIGAGLASSACGYAALIGAIDKLYGWQLPLATLSLLARLGSGSACRSFWHGFVEWQSGVLEEGRDSIGVPLPQVWPELRIGLLIVNPAAKRISSRKAMEITKTTSPFYAEWPQKHAADLARLKKAISEYDFIALGEASESNALAMHAMMLTAYPPVLYTEADTVTAMHKIWDARQSGLSIYFTQDAGPNLKLLFLEKDRDAVKMLFPELIMIAPFEDSKGGPLYPPIENVVLVDAEDKVIGVEEKLKAHQLGLLHRAFSVFIYRKNLEDPNTFEFLLQQRHVNKYHCGGLWTNTCCSHPRLNEDIILAGQRRLKEEMAIELALKHVGSFQYKASFDNGLTEHELDHVLLGEYDGVQTIVLDPREAQDFCWVSISRLQKELNLHKEHYTPWFKPAFDLVLEDLWFNS